LSLILGAENGGRLPPNVLIASAPLQLDEPVSGAQGVRGAGEPFEWLSTTAPDPPPLPDEHELAEQRAFDRDGVKPFAEAILYALSRWAGLTRKISLFAGSDGGAVHRAILASLIEAAKLNGLDPEAYLAWLMTRLVQGDPQSEIDQLPPWASDCSVKARITAHKERPAE
jgi:hypothetical protein